MPGGFSYKCEEFSGTKIIASHGIQVPKGLAASMRIANAMKPPKVSNSIVHHQCLAAHETYLGSVILILHTGPPWHALSPSVQSNTPILSASA